MIFGKYATELWEQGCQVIPCSGKRALLKGWNEYVTRRQTGDEVEHLAGCYPEANIGVVLGELSGFDGLDIDDAKQAGNFQDSPMVVQGREGRQTRLFAHTKNAKIVHANGVDLLTNGSYMIFPGSIHPDTKKPYIWLRRDCDFPELPKLVLDAGVLQPLQRTSQGGTSLDPNGGRHNALLALSYAMACAGDSVEEIATKMLASEWGNWFSDPEEAYSKGGALHGAKKFAQMAIIKADRAGIRISKGPMTIGGLDEAVEEMNAKEEEEHDPKIETEGSFDLKRAYIRPPVPEGGMMRLVYEYIQGRSFTDIPGIAAGASLAIPAGLLQNRFACGTIGANVFVMNIARSGVGKSFPYALLQQLYPRELIGAASYSSSRAMVSDIKQQREAIYPFDECAQWWEHLNTGTSFQTQMNETCCQLWTNPAGSDMYVDSSMAGKKDNERKSYNSPAITILASTTNAGILGSITKGASAKGLLPRFMIFEQPRLGWTGKNEKDLAPMLEWRDLILNHHPVLKEEHPVGHPKNPLLNPEDPRRIMRQVEFEDPGMFERLAKKYFEEAESLDKDPEYDKAFDDFYARKLEHVIRYAMIHRLGFMTKPWAEQQLKITDSDVAFGEANHNYMMKDQISFLTQVVDASEKGRLLCDLLAFIGSFGRHGVMSGLVTKKFQKVDTRLRVECIQSLAHSSDIFVKKLGGKGGGERFYHKKFKPKD